MRRWSSRSCVEGRIKAISRSATLDFSRANFDLFKDLFGGIPWAGVLEGKKVHESWLALKLYFF